MIRLYRAAFSTNCERVTLALAHKGLAGQVESVWIDYADRSPVEAVSGQGLVPVIEHDGTVVADSLAILRYLEELAPEPALFPSDPARRAEMELFLDWFDRVWKVAPNAIEADPGGPGRARAERGDGRAPGPLRGAAVRPRPPDGPRALGGRLRRLPVPEVRRRPRSGRRRAVPPRLDEHQSVEGRPALAAWIERVASR